MYNVIEYKIFLIPIIMITVAIGAYSVYQEHSETSSIQVVPVPEGDTEVTGKISGVLGGPTVVNLTLENSTADK